MGVEGEEGAVTGDAVVVVEGDAVVEIVVAVDASDPRDAADAQHSDHVLKNSSVTGNSRQLNRITGEAMPTIKEDEEWRPGYNPT